MTKPKKIQEAKKEFERCREVYKILIGEKEHQIWDIDGYEHEYGKANNQPPTYWLEMEDETLEPYIRIGSHRICWEINYKQTNYIKHKWGSADLRSGGTCTINANGRKIYSFGSSSLEYALSKAQSLVVELTEHPFNFFDQEKENGRRIWYYNLPATIQTREWSAGEISIKPDYIGEFEGRKNHWKWWEEWKKRSKYKGFSDEEDLDNEHLSEYRSSGSINHGSALSDGNIGWFRSEPVAKNIGQPLPAI
jgi:hypothetical protein